MTLSARLPIRTIAGAALAVGLVGALAGPAAAHVTLHSTDATQGGSDALIAVRVPNEEDKATTINVEIDLPTDTPLLGVNASTAPGWTFQVTSTALAKPVKTDDGTYTEAVSKVVWSGGSIPVGGFQDFNLSVATLPKVPSLTFKAVQTYSNGDVVRWIDPPAAAGQPAPDHPAPTLDLAPAAPDTSGGGSAATSTTAAGGQSAAAPTASLKNVATSSEVSNAKTIGIVGIVVGSVGVVLAAIALVTSRRRAQT